MCYGQGTDAAPEFIVSGHKVGANTATALGEAVLRRGEGRSSENRSASQPGAAAQELTEALRLVSLVAQEQQAKFPGSWDS